MRCCSLSDTAKKMMMLIIGLCCIVAGIGAVVTKSYVFSFGVLYGGAFACLKVVLMEKTITTAVEKGPKANSYARLHYLLRFFLTGLAIVIAIFNPNISMLGAVLGIISLNVSAYLMMFFQEKSGKEPEIIMKVKEEMKEEVKEEMKEEELKQDI